MECPNCGFPISKKDRPATCPKCDEDLIRVKARKPLVVDFVHHGETVHHALNKLEKALSEALWDGHPSLKVIHGYGASSGRSVIRPHVLKKLRDYAAYHALELVTPPDNPGVTILHLKPAGPRKR